MNGTLTDIPDLHVGHWTDCDAATGCTVILCPGEGAVAGVDVRGFAPGTRETSLLDPTCMVQRVHAILLSGGSAFGLAAADGVMRWLEERGRGFETGVARVPIVPAAILFDLGVGRADVRPDAAAGYAACDAANADPVAQGSVGAGTGATLGKLNGLKFAMKGGLGSASRHLGAGTVVAALVAVNAVGDVIDPANGQILAGARRADGGFADSMTFLAGRLAQDFRDLSGRNTTLAVVAANVALSKAEATVVARMAHDGLARAIRPIHTSFDGDTVFALATGEIPASPSLIGAVAADVLAEAVIHAVRSAEGLHGIPSFSDLNIGRG
jgi:L-aminopeptidase/D-esterase-like protein